MTGNVYLDWAATGFSLFNTILLFWLGTTVLLNAERRAWGIWLAGGGLLTAAVFFVSHTALLGQDLTSLAWSLRFWWYAGLALAVAMPLSWYLVILWYGGFWAQPGSALHQRHRPWLLGVLAVCAAGFVAVLLSANPLAAPLLPLPASLERLAGAAWLVAAYDVYLVACNLLTLDVLRRPGPSTRMMGALARQRARGWLLAASLLLLLVSLAVVLFLAWALTTIRQSGTFRVDGVLLARIGLFDLLVSLLIATAVVAIGQAVVAYEIFTGKTLPRRGLRRQWRQVLLLAAVFSLFAGAALALPLPPVYGLLLAALLMTASLTLLSWRAYAERQRYLDHLRPFIASQHLYDQLVTADSATPDLASGAAFRALCQDVLATRRAFLVPLGPLAALAGSPLRYPPGDMSALPPLAPLTSQFTSPQLLSLPIDPLAWAGAGWAIPLWGARGLIGVLLLGAKQDGSLYTQEEMEIARASGERLLDARAAGEMSRRLLQLQREQLAATQVADRRTRRLLHDDVLPQLHAALLALSTAGARDEAITLLGDAHRQIATLLQDVPAITTPLVARLGVLGALRHVVANELADAFAAVTWEIAPQAEEHARRLAPLRAEVLFYAAREAIRNAARHGRGPDGAAHNPLHLLVSARQHGDQLELAIEDDGIGLPAAPEGAATGRGLTLHATMMAIVGGSLVLESEPARFTRVRLTVPDAAGEAGSAREFSAPR
jgi:signal transduction histidine kinase